MEQEKKRKKKKRKRKKEKPSFNFFLALPNRSESFCSFPRSLNFLDIKFYLNFKFDISSFDNYFILIFFLIFQILPDFISPAWTKKKSTSTEKLTRQ